MNSTNYDYVVCIDNASYPASLESRKIYRRVPDAKAEGDGFVRVVDESGEDYLYPSAIFVGIPLPSDVEQALAGSA